MPSLQTDLQRPTVVVALSRRSRSATKSATCLGHPRVGALGVVPDYKHVSIDRCAKARHVWSQVKYRDPLRLDPFHDGR